jgi:predicted protein tyrosine phosphatase
MREREHKNPDGQRILFVCRHNDMRSSTAETVYKAEGLNVRSAGTSKGARVPLTEELINWADLILVMEEKHRVAIETHFGNEAAQKKIIVLNIPDNFYYMEPGLVSMIRERADPYLQQ